MQVEICCKASRRRALQKKKKTIL